MASKARKDCEVFTGKKAGKFRKDQVLEDDWYWEHFPDLFEKVEGGGVDD